MMEKGMVPRSGIDTGARWRYSRAKEWMWGYKLHLTSTTEKSVVPLAAEMQLLLIYRTTCLGLAKMEFWIKMSDIEL